MFDSTLRRRVLKVADAEETNPDLSNDEEQEVDEETFCPSGQSLRASIGVAISFDFWGNLFILSEQIDFLVCFL